MGDLEKMQPRPFKRISLRTLGQFSQDAAGKHKDAAPRRLYWRSLKGMGKSIQMIRAPTTRPTPQLIIRMSFQLAIPWRVALQHCPPPLHQPVTILQRRLPNSGDILTEKNL